MRPASFDLHDQRSVGLRWRRARQVVLSKRLWGVDVESLWMLCCGLSYEASLSPSVIPVSRLRIATTPRRLLC